MPPLNQKTYYRIPAACHKQNLLHAGLESGDQAYHSYSTSRLQRMPRTAPEATSIQAAQQSTLLDRRLHSSRWTGRIGSCYSTHWPGHAKSRRMQRRRVASARPCTASPTPTYLHKPHEVLPIRSLQFSRSPGTRSSGWEPVWPQPGRIFHVSVLEEASFVQ